MDDYRNRLVYGWIKKQIKGGQINRWIYKQVDR